MIRPETYDKLNGKPTISDKKAKEREKYKLNGDKTNLVSKHAQTERNIK